MNHALIRMAVSGMILGLICGWLVANVPYLGLALLIAVALVAFGGSLDMLFLPDLADWLLSIVLRLIAFCGHGLAGYRSGLIPGWVEQFVFGAAFLLGAGGCVKQLYHLQEATA